MALADPIQLRLSEQKKAEYEDEAARRGMGLGPYLRQRLEQGDQVAEQLAELRALIEDGFARLDAGAAGGRAAGSAAPAIDPGMLIEAVLLLRSVVQQDRVSMVHGELRRQGLQVWTCQR